MPLTRRSVIRVAILSAVLFALVFAAPVQAKRPPNCSKFSPRQELRCAHRQLRHARAELSAPIASPPHSKGYWAWRVKVSKRWIREAHRRLSHVLPLTNDWETAVRIVQRSWPGTSSWLLSCSAHEGGHGPFVMNYQGSGAGGWLQYMESTFNYHYSSALALARQSRLPVPPAGLGWTSPLAQAFAGGWGYWHQRSAWSGDPWC